MASTSLLEDMNAHLHANVFTRTFSFGSAQLPLTGPARPHLADHVILPDGNGFVLAVGQRPGRQRGTAGAVELAKWLAHDVLKRGARRIAKTRELLSRFRQLSLVNSRGHRVTVTLDPPQQFHGVIVYRMPRHNAGVQAPLYKVTSAAGFLHVISEADYYEIGDYLPTPAELSAYLAFREETLRRFDPSPDSVHELALLGQYLFEETSVAPDPRYEVAAHAFQADPGAAAFTYVVGNLGNQIARRDEESVEATYHPILRELARLRRRELRELMTQLRLSLEAVRADRFELPYRVASTATQCGFLILPGSAEFRLRAREALESLALASKHELQMAKQVSLAMWRSGEIIDIDWMYMEGPNAPNPALDHKLQRAYPFRRTSEKRLPEFFL